MTFADGNAVGKGFHQKCFFQELNPTNFCAPLCVSRKFAENKHWHVSIRGCCRGRWTSHKDRSHRTQNKTKSKSEIRTMVSQTHSSSITARSSKLMLQQKNDIIQFVQEWQWNIMLLKKNS